MSKQMSDRFEYPDLGVVVQRGPMGQPSVVTLDWVVCDDRGQDHDCKLTLFCELILDEDEVCRELVVHSIDGDLRASDDFRQYASELGSDEVTGEYQEDDRMFDVADALGRALLLDDYKDKLPTLFVRVLP